MHAIELVRGADWQVTWRSVLLATALAYAVRVTVASLGISALPESTVHRGERALSATGVATSSQQPWQRK